MRQYEYQFYEDKVASPAWDEVGRKYGKRHLDKIRRFFDNDIHMDDDSQLAFQDWVIGSARKSWWS